jgi:hypothetical protein
VLYFWWDVAPKVVFALRDIVNIVNIETGVAIEFQDIE